MTEILALAILNAVVIVAFWIPDARSRRQRRLVKEHEQRIAELETYIADLRALKNSPDDMERIASDFVQVLADWGDALQQTKEQK